MTMVAANWIPKYTDVDLIPNFVLFSSQAPVNIKMNYSFVLNYFYKQINVDTQST